MTTLDDQIGAIKQAVNDAQHEAHNLQQQGDEYEAGELLERAELLKAAINTIVTVKQLKELIK